MAKHSKRYANVRVFWKAAILESQGIEILIKSRFVIVFYEILEFL